MLLTDWGGIRARRREGRVVEDLDPVLLPGWLFDRDKAALFIRPLLNTFNGSVNVTTHMRDNLVRTWQVSGLNESILLDLILLLKILIDGRKLGIALDHILSELQMLECTK